MTTMVCVARSGGRYDDVYVERLARGAWRAIDGLDRIVCLTDMNIDIRGVERVPLHHDWPRWWAKMEAFRPDIATGRTVLLDLDTVLLGDATDLRAGKGVVAMEDFRHRGRLSSAVMAFDEGSLAHVYERFAADPDRWMGPGSCGEVPNAVHGDQVVIDRFLRDRGGQVSFFQDKHPGLIQFYNPERVPRGPVLVFIGPDKPDNADERVRRIWAGVPDAPFGWPRCQPSPNIGMGTV